MRIPENEHIIAHTFQALEREDPPFAPVVVVIWEVAMQLRTSTVSDHVETDQVIVERVAMVLMERHVLKLIPASKSFIQGLEIVELMVWKLHKRYPPIHALFVWRVLEGISAHNSLLRE